MSEFEKDSVFRFLMAWDLLLPTLNMQLLHDKLGLHAIKLQSVWFI